MPTRITIECTHCGAKLNLTDESKLGKKFKCPRCAEVFVAAAAEDDAILEIDAADDEADDEEEERPRSTRAASAGRTGAAARGKKSGKPAKSNGNTVLIIGGVAGGVVLLGGLVGVLFAAGVFGGTKADPNQIQVSQQAGPGLFSGLLKEQGPIPVPARTPVPDVAQWLPADTEFVVHLRPADILTSPLVTDLLKSMQLDRQLNAMTEGLGLKPSDLESVTFGVAQLEKAQQQMQSAQMAVMTGGQPQFGGLNTPSVAVIKLTRSISYDDLTKLATQLAQDQPIQKAQHAGKDYLETKDPKTNMTGAAWLASDSILVMGDSANVKAAIDKGANSKPLRNFGFVDWTDQLTIAFAPQKPGVLKQQLTAGSQANPMIAMALAPLAEGAMGFSFGLSAKGGLDAEIAVGCLDAPKMDAIAKSLNDLSTFGRGQYDQSKNTLPPWASALTDLLVSNLKVTSSNRVAIVTTNLPDSAKDQLVQLPGNIMATMAMSAMLGGPGQTEIAAIDSSVPTSPGDSPPGFSETTSVKATSAEGLPEGFQLTGTLLEGFRFDGAANDASSGARKLSFSLQLDFSGAPEQCLVAAIGQLGEGEATTAGGESVKLIPQTVPGLGNERSPFELYLNSTAVTSVGNGAGMLNVDIPARETEPVRSIRSTLTYLTGNKSPVVEVTDVRQQAGMESSDPTLKAAGLEIKLESRKDFGEEQEVAVISVKEGYVLSRIEAFDAQGESVFGFPETGPSERVQILRPEFNQKALKEGLGFRAFVYSDLKEVAVPFTFENVPFPKKPEK